MDWYTSPPEARRVDQVDTHHGVDFADPYAWLKESTDEQSAWLEAQQAYTAETLDRTQWFDRLERRMATRLSRNRPVELPRAFGPRFMVLRRGDLIDVSGPEESFITHIPQGRILANGSACGTRIAVAVTDSSDRVAFQIVDVETAEKIGDPVDVGVAAPHYPGCVALGRGTLYCTIRESWSTSARVVAVTDGEIETLFTTDPDMTVRLFLSEDETTLLLLNDLGETATHVYLKDLDDVGEWRRIVPDSTGRCDSLWIDHRLFLRTDWLAPNGRVIEIDTATGESIERIAEAETPILHFSSAGDRLFVGYLDDVQTRVSAFTMDGEKVGDVPSFGQQTQSPMFGSRRLSRAAFTVSDYHQPAALVWYDVRSNSIDRLIDDVDDVSSEQVWYESTDGTRIPMTIIHRQDVDPRRVPTILYGYGGWGLAVYPWYDPFIAEWVSLGGVYAIANVRGGSEFGASWHHAGRRRQKENVFADFVSAAHWLIDRGFTEPRRLAIRGFSNGGLLMGVMATRFPELFAAVSAHIAPFDLTNFDANPSVKRELGDPEDPDDFAYLMGYSPYQNIRAKNYPAIVITAGAQEVRLETHDALRMVARLQHATTARSPILLRYLRTMGHGMSRLATSVADQARHDAEELAFLCEALALDPKDGAAP